MYSSATTDRPAAEGERGPTRRGSSPPWREGEEPARRFGGLSLSYRGMAMAIGGLGLLLLSPAIWTNRVADDYIHQLMLRAKPGIAGLERHPLDLFRFATGSAATARELIQEGVFPWWADPEAQIAFFRPLSSATHWLDHALFPASTVAMHLHSLAWFAVVMAIVAACYQRLSGAGVPALLAFALFALDDAHAPAVGWIANRNALIAAAGALLALLCLHRYRTEGLRLFSWLGPGCLALGFLGGEAAISGAAYLLAYAVWLDRGTWLERLTALAPYGLVVVFWKAGSAALGYGVRASGVYLDPLADSAEFLTAGAPRFLALLLALLAAPFADLWEVYPLVAPAAQGWVAAGAVLVLGLFGVSLYPAWRRSREVRFFAAGAFLSLVPACATFPHDRLLLIPSFGAMAAIAVLLREALRARRKLAASIGGGALALVHLGLAPALLPLRSSTVDGFDQLLRASAHSLPSGPAVGEQTLVLLNPALDPLASYLPLYQQSTGRTRPAQLLWLAPGCRELEVRTLGPHRLELKPRGGFVVSASERMLRRPETGPAIGETLSLPGSKITVTEATADGRPLRIVVAFELPLRSPKLVFLRWDGVGYAPFDLPAVGQRQTLDAIDVAALLGRTWSSS